MPKYGQRKGRSKRFRAIDVVVVTRWRSLVAACDRRFASDGEFNATPLPDRVDSGQVFVNALFDMLALNSQRGAQLQHGNL
jgi:hypothetical protein